MAKSLTERRRRRRRRRRSHVLPLYNTRAVGAKIAAFNVRPTGAKSSRS
jgi:hypothetical protein